MTLRSTALAAATAAILAGCAAPSRGVAPEAAQGIKRFGVVSVIAGDLTRQHVGITVFGNEREVRPIGAWHLDEVYEKHLAEAGAHALKATFVPQDIDRTPFLKVNDPNGPWDAPAFSGANWDGIQDAVKAACRKGGLDALFVMGKRKSGDLFGGTNQQLVGIGLYTRGDSMRLHVLGNLGLLDCRSGQPMGRYFFTWFTGWDEEALRQPVATWSPATEEHLRQHLADLPEIVWENSMRGMGLAW